MSLHQMKTSRISVDLPIEMHVHLKVACARKGIPMQQFVRDSIAKSLEELEMRLDEKSFDQGMQEIKEHGTVSEEEFKEKMGL